MAQSPKLITFPQTFQADIAYRAGAGVFSLPGAIGIGLSIAHHDPKTILALALPFAVFVGALIFALSFELTVDDSGLHQRSLLGRRELPWAQVERLDQSRAYSIHGEGGREIVWLSMVTTVAQQAIAEEAVRRASLRPSGEKMVYPMRNQWVR